MSDIQIEVQLVKVKDLETNLNNLLKSYTKAQLTEMAENLNTETKKSWRKDKLISSLQDSILEQATTIYGEILEEVLSHLPDAGSQVYRLNELEDIKAFAPLIQKGFFFVSKEENDYIFIIPDEVKEVIQVSTDTIKSEGEEATKKEIILKEWKERQIAIFGNYSAEHLKTVWNRYYEDDLTVEEVITLL